jgi:hypothetical protein
MIGIMTILLQHTSKTPRKLGINEKDHPDTVTTRLVCANFAA